MDGGEVITVVSVIVAGVLSPWIAGKIASLAQDRRLKHERTLHDLDDLRRELDRMGDAIGDFIRAVPYTVLLLPPGQERDEKMEFAFVRSAFAWERAARLKIRLGDDAPVVDAALAVVTKLDNLREESEGLDKDEIRQRVRAVGDANTAFFRAAYDLIGADVGMRQLA